MQTARHVAAGSFAGLIALGLLWELWLAPLHPGGSTLALKVIPLVFGLPGIARGRVRSYQVWSMGILAYLCEGLVRATSDTGMSARLAVVEVALSLLAFAAVLVFARAVRKRT